MIPLSAVCVRAHTRVQDQQQPGGRTLDPSPHHSRVRVAGWGEHPRAASAPPDPHSSRRDRWRPAFTSRPLPPARGSVFSLQMTPIEHTLGGNKLPLPQPALHIPKSLARPSSALPSKVGRVVAKDAAEPAE